MTETKTDTISSVFQRNCDNDFNEITNQTQNDTDMKIFHDSGMFENTIVSIENIFSTDKT